MSPWLWMRYSCVKTDMTDGTKHGGHHMSEVSILPLQAAQWKELKEWDNNNWQNIVIHTACNPKCLEFSANPCIYSKLWRENCGWDLGPWNSKGGLSLCPRAASSVKKGCWDRAVSHNDGYREGRSRFLCALCYTMWSRRKEVAEDLKWIKRNNILFYPLHRLLSRIKILNSWTIVISIFIPAELLVVPVELQKIQMKCFQYLAA